MDCGLIFVGWVLAGMFMQCVQTVSLVIVFMFVYAVLST